jgi:hypothetical protein
LLQTAALFTVFSRDKPFQLSPYEAFSLTILSPIRSHLAFHG